MEIQFSDLIENGKIPDLTEKFYRIIGIPVAIHDTGGNILCSFGKPDICETFHSLNPEAKKICEDSSVLLKNKLANKKKLIINKCKNNFYFAASPITVAGRHLANFHTGSFFMEKPDIIFFEKQAARFGFEKAPYLNAVKDTPVITENRLKDIMSFITSLSELIGATWKNEIDRQSTVEKLLESESRYRELVENANSIILRKNAKGKITFFNEYAEKFFGFSKNEVLGKSTIETIVPETDSTGLDLKKMVREIIESPEKFSNNENENICKDGKRIWVSWTNKAIVDEKGKVKELLCIGNDITSQKKAGDEIKASKEFLENIFNSTLDGLIVCDSKGIIESSNSAIEKILGYKAEEIKGKHISSVVVPDENNYNMAVKAREDLFEKGSINNFETTWIRKDGSTCPVEINSHLIRDQQGNIVRAINSIRNISKRRKAEETALQLKKAIEQAAEIVTIIGDNGEIKYVNPALEKITGYPPEKLTGSNPFLSKTKKYGYSFYEEIWTALNKGQVWKGHMSPLKPDGTTCELDITISPIRDTSGMITSYVSISRDVSNELKLENQLRQTQKMEAIGLLAGGIAHDFNNILGAVIGFTEMAHYDAPKDSPIKYNLEQVLESCVRAKNLVKQILAFSRQSKEGRIPTYIHLIVKETIKLLRASLPSTVEIHHNIETQEDMLLADTTQIHQLIMNLCTNAAHSMRKKGGVLTVNLSSVTLDCDIVSVSPDLLPGDYIKLTISDTGVGISSDIIGKIFEPFFTTKAEGEGTGMGLTAVKGIVKNHNGSITVNSKPGKGTTFHIFLPKTQEKLKAKEEEEEEAMAPLPTGNEHILLIDDETLLVSVGKKILTSQGYSVTAKRDSNEALELFKQNPEAFDIVITDQTMPHLTGYDLAKKIIKIRPDIPIVLCTGYSESISEKKAKSIGIREYMLKPLNRKDLAETVRRILDGKEQ